MIVRLHNTHRWAANAHMVGDENGYNLNKVLELYLLHNVGWNVHTSTLPYASLAYTHRCIQLALHIHTLVHTHTYSRCTGYCNKWIDCKICSTTSLQRDLNVATHPSQNDYASSAYMSSYLHVRKYADFTSTCEILMTLLHTGRSCTAAWSTYKYCSCITQKNRPYFSWHSCIQAEYTPLHTQASGRVYFMK